MFTGTISHLQRIVGCSTAPRHTDRQPPDHECTLTEVAERLGVSRQYAWTLENSAIRKCRKFCVDRGIRLEDVLG
jgi:DNA-directed RNA polymerase sigma subunit (sigma70/sigma32)